MDNSITHILVPVDPDVNSQAAQLAAMRLATADSAIVTLLYVHERHARIRAAIGLDAIASLHHVMMAAPEENQVAPVFPDRNRRHAIRRLREMRDRLIEMGYDESQIRAVCRRGEIVEETIAFIEEAGVEVVLIQSPGTSNSPALRRLAQNLQRNCPCQLQIVHPPQRRSKAPSRSFFGWWNSIATRCRNLVRA